MGDIRAYLWKPGDEDSFRIGVQRSLASGFWEALTSP